MTTMQPEHKRGPGRPRKEERADRAEATQERRRRRNSGAYVHGKRMGVNPALLDFKVYEYRWLNDEPGRLVAMTKHDDWDIVSNDGGAVKEDSSDLGNAVSLIVGSNPDGSPKRAYLARKPKEFFEEDQKAKQAELDEQLRQMRRGMTRDGASQSDYVPHAGISM